MFSSSGAFNPTASFMERLRTTPAPAASSSVVRIPAPVAYAAGADVPKGKDGPFGVIELYSAKYFGVCAIGGALSCGLTHTLVTPLDLVKCNMQANPKEYTGLIQGFGVLRKSETISMFRGWAPTLIGYSMQGVCKFGFYEFFKHYYAGIVGEETFNNYKSLVFCAASASAEFIADIALCPMESVKVRIQTDAAYSQQKGLVDGFGKLMGEEGASGFFKSLAPLWARQIPYTIMKFVAFEKVVELIYASLPRPKAEYNKVQQLGVTFLAGYIAGVFCAVVSHPADTMVSKLGKVKKAPGEGTMDSVKKIYGEIGFGGLWRGLGARVIMVGTLTGLQWFIYDSFKVWVGLPTTGGPAKK